MQSDEVTIVPRAQEKTYKKVKNKSDMGIFVDVARGLGRALKQFRSLFFNFMTQVKEPINEAEKSIREIKKNNYKQKTTSGSKSNISTIAKRRLNFTSDAKMSRVELVRDLVTVFREVSGTFIEFFRTIASPVRDFKKEIVNLDYSEEYEPQKFRPRSSYYKKRTTMRVIVLKPIVKVNINGTRQVRRRILRKKLRRRVLRKRSRVKSDQTKAMEELLTHL